MDLFDFVNLAADMVLDAVVELTSYYFPPDVDNDYLHRLKQHAARRPARRPRAPRSVHDFCVAPGPERDKQMELVRTWVDHAAGAPDAPVIRIFAGRVPKWRYGRGLPRLTRPKGSRRSLPLRRQAGRQPMLGGTMAGISGDSRTRS